MEKISGNPRLLAAPIAVALVLGLILMSAILPMIKMNPKNIPVGIVAADQGEIGKTLAAGLMRNAPETVRLVPFESMERLEKAMDEREVYGALVLPQDFSAKLATLRTGAPEKATVQICVNEGANPTVANLIQNALANMASMLNARLSVQMLAESPDAPIPAGRVADYANPVQAEFVKVHAAGNMGNAPLSFLTGVWFTSLIGAVALYLFGNRRRFESGKEKLKLNTIQSVMPFVYGLVAGYALAWYSIWLYGFEYESFHKVALYLALVVAAFVFMIFATLRWLRLPSIVIYVLLMFFSMPAVQLAPEMMPAFYRDWLISWLPIRIYVDGLREILFFSGDYFNAYSMILVWILFAALVLVWVKNVTEKANVTETAKA
jgi:hypothetical protein